MSKHTPTPWVVVSRPDFNNGLTYTSIQPATPDVVSMRPLLMASGEHHVCRMTHTAARHAIDMHQANAAFIVKAVNNHDALVKALNLALCYLGKLEPGDSRAVSDEFVAMASVLSGDSSHEVMDVIDTAIGALSLQALQEVKR